MANSQNDGCDGGGSQFDYDYVVVGSGFGGSVAAMRLAQKGYRVCVIEVGRRYKPEDLPKTNWNLFRSLWAPALRMFGIWRVSVLRHVVILGASAVGGGSINFGNTLYIPPKKFFENERVREADRVRPLLPYYELAKKMLGAVRNPVTTSIDIHLKATADEMGRGHTYRPTDVAVYFGKKSETVPDPYFLGEGPDRTGCELCGGCMVGCRYNAKNTLDRNYLYFAEKLGAAVISEHKVVKVRPLGNDDGSRGYEIEAVRVTGLYRRPKRTITARGVVFSAGVLGTVDLLLTLKEKGVLPRLSGAIGQRVCTNSEALVGVRSNDSSVDFSHGVAITSSVFPDDATHIEPCRFSKGSDLFGLAPVVITDGGALPRPLQFLINTLRHPIQSLRWRNPFGFARRSVYLLVMQTLESHIGLARRRHLWWPFPALASVQEKGRSIPVYIPVANEFARRLAQRIGGIAGNNINEVLLGKSTTAHILGGCNMSSSPQTGVIDLENRVFGYENMLICDGSMIPVNLGVNPSLSITAFSERAMSFIPPKGAQPFRHLKVEQAWGVTELVGAGAATSSSK